MQEEEGFLGEGEQKSKGGCNALRNNMNAFFMLFCLKYSRAINKPSHKQLNVSI
jgi:hypothetical protein